MWHWTEHDLWYVPSTCLLTCQGRHLPDWTFESAGLNCGAPAQATDEELHRAHTVEHVSHISGPAKAEEWLIGDNFYSELTPTAARYAAGCTVEARS